MDRNDSTCDNLFICTKDVDKLYTSQTLQQAKLLTIHVLGKTGHCHDLPAEENKSPAEGKGARPPPRSGSLVKSGRFSKWDLSSCLTS